MPELSGYEAELLIAAIRVDFSNYVLVTDDEPQEYIKMSIECVQGFIDQYV